jgi:hypothetical protein
VNSATRSLGLGHEFQWAPDGIQVAAAGVLARKVSSTSK